MIDYFKKLIIFTGALSAAIILMCFAIILLLAALPFGFIIVLFAKRKGLNLCIWNFQIFNTEETRG